MTFKLNPSLIVEEKELSLKFAPPPASILILLPVESKDRLLSSLCFSWLRQGSCSLQTGLSPGGQSQTHFLTASLLLGKAQLSPTPASPSLILPRPSPPARAPCLLGQPCPDPSSLCPLSDPGLAGHSQGFPCGLPTPVSLSSFQHLLPEASLPF